MPETNYNPDPRPQPPTTHLSREYGNAGGGGGGAAVVDEDAITTQDDASLWNCKEVFFSPKDTAVTSMLGMGSDATTAAANFVTATSTGLLHGVQMQTSTTLNNQAFHATDAGSTGKPFFFSWRTRSVTAARLSQTADCRCWIGFTTAVAATQLASDTPATSYIGFRASSAVPDSTWKAVVGDGSSQTVVDTGVAVSTTATQFFRIDWDAAPTEVRFYINDTLVATISTTLPAQSTDFKWIIGVTNLAASVARYVLSMLRIRYTPLTV